MLKKFDGRNIFLVDRDQAGGQILLDSKSNILSISVLFILDNHDNQQASGLKSFCCLEADWRSELNKL